MDLRIAPTDPLAPTSGLAAPAVRSALHDLHARADAHDADVLPDVLREAAARGATSDVEVADLLANAYLPVSPEAGRLLHLLASWRPAGRIVEFGCSMGVSTIYLAAALGAHDAPVVTTELEPAKVDAARRNLRTAGLAARVDVHAGDAFRTLATLRDPVSMLVLDGWKGAYLPMLRLLEPLLVDGAVVVADDTELLADLCADYVAHVRDPAHGYTSVGLAVGDGIELSRRHR